MTHNTPPFGRRTIVLGTLAAALAGAPALAQQPQVFFSVDYHGPTKSRPDSGGSVPISEGDILRRPLGAGPFQVTAAPFTQFTAGQIGITLYATCSGSPSGQSCGVEVDAISFGNEDRYPGPTPGVPQPRLYFSVDRFAQGVASSIGSPSVRTEALSRDASSDIYTPVLDLVPPTGPGAASSNRLVFDGNGVPSTTGGLAPGLGLAEPHSPQPAPAVDAGDNLDALAVGALPTGPQAAIYYSLDGAFPDPNGIPHSGSAQLNGFSPSAVIRKPLSTGSPTVYASPAQLGLSAFNDDLDALALWDNGDGIFQPSQAPYDWLGPPVGGTDMLLFSVRRGSAVVGQPDSRLGLLIEPGDILIPPIAGGVSTFPAIFIAAETMGLSTQRSAGGPRDELDAIALEIDPYFDCNGNGVEDSVDIGQGASNDSNNNGIPDECERTYGRYCECAVGLGPCGNDSPATGCLNSTGAGATLDGLGTTSVTTDDLQFVAASMPGSTSTLLFAGPNQTNTAFGDGRRCVASPVYRLGIQTASGGTTTYGPGIRNTLCTSFSQCMSAGSTFNFQVWYRNAASYCTSSTFNLTNGLTVTYTP